MVENEMKLFFLVRNMIKHDNIFTVQSLKQLTLNTI